MNIERMMQIANRAKTIGKGDYTLPNVIFAVLLEVFFDFAKYGQTQKIDKGRVSHLSVRLETQDLDGETPDEVWFDLLTFVAIDQSADYDAGEDCAVDSLCIPVPLVNRYTLVAAMKGIEIVDREDHCRNYEQVDDDGQELGALWTEFLGAFPAEQVIGCARMHLDPEAFRNLVIPILAYNDPGL